MTRIAWMAILPAFFIVGVVLVIGAPLKVGTWTSNEVDDGSSCVFMESQLENLVTLLNTSSNVLVDLAQSNALSRRPSLSAALGVFTTSGVSRREQKCDQFLQQIETKLSGITTEALRFKSHGVQSVGFSEKLKKLQVDNKRLHEKLRQLVRQHSRELARIKKRYNEMVQKYEAVLNKLIKELEDTAQQLYREKMENAVWNLKDGKVEEAVSKVLYFFDKVPSQSKAVVTQVVTQMWTDDQRYLNKTLQFAEQLPSKGTLFACEQLLQQQMARNNSQVNQLCSIFPLPMHNITIVVFGRSGSGITSTIRELIGTKSACTNTDGDEASFPNLMEYTITGIPSIYDAEEYSLKLVDVPGFVDGRHLEQDAKILASLKSYIQSNGPPTFYLALSRFDDNRFNGAHSLFVQFLKRVELFQSIYLNNSLANSNVTGSRSKMTLVLTRLMGETKTTQRRPERKIADFRKTIQNYTAFQSPISIVVGDNHAGSDYDAPLENGYYKLLNKEYYPKNIWYALINASTAGDDITANLLTSIMNSREIEMKCEAKMIISSEWDYYDDDADAFSYLLKLSNWTIVENEVNTEIQYVFDEMSNTQSEEIVQKTALQLRLQQLNITAVVDLPRNRTDQAVFFQKNKQFSAPIPANLLNYAFQLKMPEYMEKLTVGYGYLVMTDEMSQSTPFITDFKEASSVGYQFPNFIKCKKLFNPEIEHFQSYSVNISDYIEKRIQYLHFAGNYNFTHENFMGKVKEGFNLQPELYENMATLIAVEERRVIICKLVADHTQWILDPEFIMEVDALVEFDPGNKTIVTEWINWFEKWGTHVVVQGYGGGTLEGSLFGSKVKRIMESSSTTINETLKAISTYSPFPVDDLGLPEYRVYGGESDASSIENLYSLTEGRRNNLINKWEGTLSANFKMLVNELRLEPISLVVKEGGIGVEKGQMIENVVRMLINGEVNYPSWKKEQEELEKLNEMQAAQRTLAQSRHAILQTYMEVLAAFRKREEEALERRINELKQRTSTDESSHQHLVTQINRKWEGGPCPWHSPVCRFLGMRLSAVEP